MIQEMPIKTRKSWTFAQCYCMHKFSREDQDYWASRSRPSDGHLSSLFSWLLHEPTEISTTMVIRLDYLGWRAESDVIYVVVPNPLCIIFRFSTTTDKRSIKGRFKSKKLRFQVQSPGPIWPKSAWKSWMSQFESWIPPNLRHFTSLALSHIPLGWNLIGPNVWCQWAGSLVGWMRTRLYKLLRSLSESGTSKGLPLTCRGIIFFSKEKEPSEIAF